MEAIAQALAHVTPFRKYSGGGGAAMFAKALAAAVEDVDDCPDSDTRYSAQLFGLICASANIESADLTIVHVFMGIAYEDSVPDFTKGLTRGSKDERAAEQETAVHMVARSLQSQRPRASSTRKVCCGRRR